MSTPAPEVPRSALVLGFSGLIPFIVPGLAVWIATPTLAGLFHTLLIAYAMVIASFMAGVQWGFGCRAEIAECDRWRVLAVSVVPALVAWAGVFSPFPWPYAFLLAAFAMVLRFDLKLVREGLAPAWYPQLRLPLSAAVMVALASASLHGILVRSGVAP